MRHSCSAWTKGETGRVFVQLPQRFQQLFGAHDAAEPPARHGISLGEGIMGKGSLPHPREGG